MHFLPKLSGFSIVFCSPRQRICAQICLCVLALLSITPGRSLAQQLTPYVVSSSGGFYSNASGTLSFTTCEMSAVETFIAPSAILTQGFQQYWDLGTYTKEHPNPHFSFGIYPNPSDGHFNLLTETEKEGHVVGQILDVFGRVIQSSEFEHHGGRNIHPFDLTLVAPGMYILTITFKGHRKASEYPFVTKIQVIR